MSNPYESYTTAAVAQDNWESRRSRDQYEPNPDRKHEEVRDAVAQE